MPKIKKGSRVEVKPILTKTWGYDSGVGTVTGGDPRGINKEVWTVKLDCGESIFEAHGVHQNNFELLEEDQG